MENNKKIKPLIRAVVGQLALRLIISGEIQKQC